MTTWQEIATVLFAARGRNTVHGTDRFNLGSISKVVAAHLIGAMIDAQTPGLAEVHFGPLNMTRSRFGRAPEGADDGPRQHGWNAANFTVYPRAGAQSPGYDTSTRPQPLPRRVGLR